VYVASIVIFDGLRIRVRSFGANAGPTSCTLRRFSRPPASNPLHDQWFTENDVDVGSVHLLPQELSVQILLENRVATIVKGSFGC
jgi:hypothetical protein